MCIRNALLVAALLTTLPTAPLDAQAAQRTSRDFDAAWGNWLEADISSPEESRWADSIRAFVPSFLGEESIRYYHLYLDAPIGSPEEEAALDSAILSATRYGDVRPERARELLDGYFSVEFHRQTVVDFGIENPAPPPEIVQAVDTVAVGGVISLPGLEVLVVPTEPLKIGETWSLTGRVTNHTEESVYLRESSSTVRLDPPLSEFVGGSSQPLYVSAHFPTGVRRIQRGAESWVQVPPGEDFPMTWSVSPAPGEGGYVASVLGGPLGRFPGEGFFSVAVGLPKEDGAPRYARAIPRFTLNVTAPLTVVLPLAWLGGLLMLLIQLAFEAPKGSESESLVTRYKQTFRVSIFPGILAMLAMIAVVLVANQNLNLTSLLPSFELNSHSAFITIGALAQLVGWRPIKKALLREALVGV